MTRATRFWATASAFAAMENRPPIKANRITTPRIATPKINFNYGGYYSPGVAHRFKGKA